MFEETKVSARGRLYGVCFSGSRKCMKKLIAKTVKRNDVGDFSYKEIERWCRCSGCADMPIHDLKDHELFLAPMHVNTCVAGVFRTLRLGSGRNMEQIVKRMCMGCKVAILCRHNYSGFLNHLLQMENKSIHLFQRLQMLTLIQGEIRRLGLCLS